MIYLVKRGDSVSNSDIMKKQLHNDVILPLTEQGFTGKWTHFRRVHPDYVELLSFRESQNIAEYSRRSFLLSVVLYQSPPPQIKIRFPTKFLTCVGICFIIIEEGRISRNAEE